MFSLGLLSPGEQGEIVALRQTDAQDGTPASGRTELRMEDLGLRAGKQVEMLSNGATVLVRVDESRIALDRKTAMKILVRR